MDTSKTTASNTRSALPSGWRWAKLGEVCELIMGQSPPSSTYTSEREGLPFFQGKADFGDFYPTVRAWCTHPIKVAEERDVLISVRAPVGPVNMSNIKCCIGRGLAAIRCKNGANNWFIFWYLRLLENQIASLGSGSTFGAISRDDLINFQVPLPSEESQRHIAAKIQELMQEISNLKSAISNQLDAANALPSAYLRQVFESPEAKKWERKRLGEVCEIVTGSTPRTDNLENWNGEILWATPNEMGKLAGFTILDTERKLSKKGFNGCSVKLLPPGSVLLTTRAPIGHSAINLKPMCTNQGFKSLIPSSKVYNWFLFFTLKHYIPVLQSMGRGQTFKEISKQQVEDFEIALPAYKIQKEIADELKEKIEKGKILQSTILNQQSTIDALPQAILRKAFRGEL